jgi:hypothetical protein
MRAAAIFPPCGSVINVADAALALSVFNTTCTSLECQQPCIRLAQAEKLPEVR